MKKLFYIFTSIYFGFVALNFCLATEKPILYYGNGCLHCAKVENYIRENDLDSAILQKEIYQNSSNAEEFNTICEQENIDLMERGVPFLYADGECFIGDKQILNYLEITQTEEEKSTEASQTAEEIKTDFADQLTLPILLSAAIVDAINPCAFAVLLILMTTILATREKKRALWSGISFSISIFISYLLMGLGLYSVIASVETTGIFMKIIGFIAILLGIFNLKDFFWYGKGFLMEVPMSWRPKLQALIKSITNPVGAFLIGLLVSLFLLPCTSGPYIVIIGMLGHKETYSKALLLLILYNFVFIFPMLGITIGTYLGLDVKKAEAKRVSNLKILHLIAGLIMLGMGIVLLTGII